MICAPLYSGHTVHKINNYFVNSVTCEKLQVSRNTRLTSGRLHGHSCTSNSSVTTCFYGEQKHLYYRKHSRRKNSQLVSVMRLHLKVAYKLLFVFICSK